MTARWSITTPAGRAGAIGLIALAADTPEALDRALADLACDAPAPGALSVRTIAAIDRGVIARWSPTRADLMPHAGVAVMRALADDLTRRLGPPTTDTPARETYPEAASELEARTLAALATAASPRAIDLLLDQTRRWAPIADDPDRAPANTECADARPLAHLLTPALVVAVGPPNVGKSSLLNVLAGRPLALEADLPGTTRDHVGALLELDALAVRYVDTPGVGAHPQPADADAAALARDLAARADLIVSCSDASAPPVPTPPGVPALRVSMRSDLGPPADPADVTTSARTGVGIAELARAIRSALVPDAALADPRPWRFWAPPADNTR
ncbi:MAG: hypothetical protein DHS20C14_22380 [Phycisphaeraceae bacterium]|nr:MAG: hypothetical protein DHS20C14_22380 [Phycisphaeraceae bacterium]